MKIRNSFVTNSSSSSYVLVGKGVKIEDIKIDEKVYTVLGTYLSDGQDVFDLNSEIYDYLKGGDSPFENYRNLNKYTNFEIFESIIVTSGDFSIKGSELISKLDPEDNYYVIGTEADHHSTETLEDFKGRYTDED